MLGNFLKIDQIYIVVCFLKPLNSGVFFVGNDGLSSLIGWISGQPPSYSAAGLDLTCLHQDKCGSRTERVRISQNVSIQNLIGIYSECRQLWFSDQAQRFLWDSSGSKLFVKVTSIFKLCCLQAKSQFLQHQIAFVGVITVTSPLLQTYEPVFYCILGISTISVVAFQTMQTLIRGLIEAQDDNV